jgi:hypothetical protein
MIPTARSVAGMNKTLKRARAVMTDLVTWVVFGSAVATIATEEIAQVVPSGWQDNVVVLGGRVAAWLGAAVMILRRVTTVLPSERGLLPPED